MLEIRDVSVKEAMSKQEIIRKIASQTGQKYSDIREVLDSFEDIFREQVLTIGAFKYGCLPTVERKRMEPRNQRDVSTGKMVTRPATCQLRAKIPDIIKKEHQGIFKSINEGN